MLNKNELCNDVSKTCSKYTANNKNYLLKPQVKVILPQVKMLQERFLVPNMKCP